MPYVPPLFPKRKMGKGGKKGERKSVRGIQGKK